MAWKTYEGIGYSDGVERIKKVYEGMYGGDNVYDRMILGNKRIGTSEVKDFVEIDTDSGNFKINLESTQPDTRSIVEESLGEVKSEKGREAIQESSAIGSHAGGGNVTKEFSHSEAKVKRPSDDDYDPNHSKCKSCAWYDNNGNCRIVEDIEPNYYCENFYADVLVAAHEHPDKMEVNLVAWGSNADFGMKQIKELADRMKDRLR